MSESRTRGRSPSAFLGEALGVRRYASCSAGDHMDSRLTTELDLAVLAANQTAASDAWLRSPLQTRAAAGANAARPSTESTPPPWLAPRATAPSLMPASIAPPSIAPTSNFSWPMQEAGRETRALIVEDDPTTLRAYQRILLKRGVLVTAASSPDEALALVSALAPELRPSLLFLDVIMPRLNGAAFIAALRSLAGTVQIPVILISALNLATVRDYAQQWGANGFILKTKGMLHLEAAFDEWVRYALRDH